MTKNLQVISCDKYLTKYLLLFTIVLADGYIKTRVTNSYNKKRHYGSLLNFV